MAGAVLPASEIQVLSGEAAAVQHSVDQQGMPGREAAPAGPCTEEQKVGTALPRKRKLEFVSNEEETDASKNGCQQVTSIPWELRN